MRLGLFLIALVSMLSSALAIDIGYQPETRTRITLANGKSRTARNNARCICITSDGKAHMVWEDTRLGNFEIYYAWIDDGKVSPNIRISRSKDESSYPAIACDSQDVYILWQEFTGRVFNLYYVHLRDSIEVARKQITRTHLDSSCPVAAVGPDGSLHIAWHEGPYKQTAIYYGRIVADSLVEVKPISLEHPEAFRPDIACDDSGRVLIVWFDGMEVKSKLWDGKIWGDEELVATNNSRPWRLSVISLSNGKWAAAWFDNVAGGSTVKVKFYDGKKWYGEEVVNSSVNGYYPSLVRIADGDFMIVWEEKDVETGTYRIMLRRYRLGRWSQRLEVYREKLAGRYPSLAVQGDELHMVYFSPVAGNDEIYHLLLRRKQ